MSYRADIDGLRAIAVLLVLVFHFDLLRMGEAGFIGVDMFYVVSGFLISTIIWRELESGTFSLRRFYTRRIRRLAPALMVVQLLVLAAAALLLLPLEVLDLAKESFFAQVYLSNVYYWRTLDYFGLQADSAFLLHTWSLGVEEQFYLLFPVFLIVIYRWAPRRLGPALALLSVASFMLNLALIGVKPQATFYLLPTRAWEMGVGSLAALAAPFFVDHRCARATAATVAVALLLSALITYRSGIAFPGWFALLPTGAAALAILAGTNGDTFVPQLLARSWLVRIGRISYPLYLVHWPLHIFGQTLLLSYGPAIRWGLFGLSILLAYAINRWIEQPFKTSPRLRSDARVIGLYLAALIGILMILATVSLTDGWRGRFGPGVLRLADAAADFDPAQPQRDFGRSDTLDQKLVSIGTPGVPPRWLIFGDSHAGALTDAFSRWLASRGEAGLLAFHSSCLPVLDTGTPLCRRFTRDVLDRVRADRAIGNVVLVSIWRQPLEPGYTDKDGRIVEGPAAQQSFQASFHASLVAFHDAGVGIYLWRPLPSMPGKVPSTMARRLLYGIDRPVAVPLAEHRRTFRFLDEALARDRALLAGIADPAPALCPAGICRGDLDGRPLYRDNNHPTLSQSPRLARILQQELGTVPLAVARP